MAVARVSEITSTSESSFDDAIKRGLERSTKTLRNVEGAWVKAFEVRMQDNQIKEFKVTLMVTFLLEDPS